MTLHPTSTIERLIAAERAVKDAIAELSDISSDADYLLEDAAAAIRDQLEATARRYGGDYFPPRTAEAVLRDHNYVLYPEPVVAGSPYLNAPLRTLEQAEADTGRTKK